MQIIENETVHLRWTYLLQMIWAPATQSPTPDTRPLKRAASINFILPIIQMSVSSQFLVDLAIVFLWFFLNTEGIVVSFSPYWHWVWCNVCNAVGSDFSCNFNGWHFHCKTISTPLRFEGIVCLSTSKLVFVDLSGGHWPLCRGPGGSSWAF